LQAFRTKLLKKDIFGCVEQVESGSGTAIRRDTQGAALPVAWLARALMRREARALAMLDGVNGVPELMDIDRHSLCREFIDGQPMQDARPTDINYFHAAAKLLRQLHRAGIAHNDLAKEPNFLQRPDASPALIDFQLATISPRRGRLFRTLAREDIRHLLKHKRTYCPASLTAREKRILSTPSTLNKIWMNTGKPMYLFVTRRILGWQDREGAGDRT